MRKEKSESGIPFPDWVRDQPFTADGACRAVAEMTGIGAVEQEWGTELLSVLENARDGHREIDVIGAVALALTVYGGMIESRVCNCPKCRGRRPRADPAFIAERTGVLAQEIAQSCRTPGELMLILGKALGLVMKAMRDAAS